MILCLRCGRLNSGGSNYCGGGCGAFRGGRCPEGHVTSGVRCSTCGREASVQETPSLSFGCLGHLVAWGLVIVCLRFAFQEGNLPGQANRIFTFIVGRPIGSIIESVLSVLATVGIFALVLQGLLGDRVNVLKGYGKFLAFLWTGFWKAVVILSRGLYALVEGRPALDKPKRERREREVNHEER
jgi:hypothetical protein